MTEILFGRPDPMTGVFDFFLRWYDLGILVYFMTLYHICIPFFGFLSVNLFVLYSLLPRHTSDRHGFTILRYYARHQRQTWGARALTTIHEHRSIEPGYVLRLICLMGILSRRYIFLYLFCIFGSAGVLFSGPAIHGRHLYVCLMRCLYSQIWPFELWDHACVTNRNLTLPLDVLVWF